MYLNTKKENTNIDKEFKSREKAKFDIEKYKKPLIIGGGILLLIILIIVVIIILKKPKYFIILDGAEEISMYEGEEYIELGYSGKDNKGKDLTSEIKVINNVDVNSVGTYEIIYKLKRKTRKRTINVVEKGIGKTSIYLKGKDNIVLDVGSKYDEPGYIAIDSVDGDISNKVKTKNQVDTSKPGTYRIVYTVENSSKITTTKTRTVIVK